MLPFLKQKKKRTGKKTKQKGFSKYCITLRQCAILFSILIFIFTAIFTTCAILGYLHAKNTIDILRDEIRIEREKSQRDYSLNNFRISTNEILLIHSQSSLKTNESILKTFMHLGWLLMVMSGFLIYGTTTKSPRFMIPWILTSAVVYLCVIMGEILIYLDYIEGLNLNTNVVLIITMVVSTVFISMWYTMVLYHSTMKCRGCSQIISSKPKIIQAYGGYVHTINPNSLIKSKKPLV